MRSNRSNPPNASLTLDALPIPAAMLDAEQRVVHANKALRRLLGRRGPVLGADLSGLLTRAGGQVAGEATYCFVQANGPRHLRLDVQPWAGGALALLVDVSAERAMLEAQRTIQQTHSQLMHDAEVGTWRYDPDNDAYWFS